MLLFGIGSRSIILKRYTQEKEGFRVCCGRDSPQDWSRMRLVMGCDGSWNQGDSWISTSKEQNMFVAERFISSLIKHYDRHPIYTDG